AGHALADGTSGHPAVGRSGDPRSVRRRGGFSSLSPKGVDPNAVVRLRINEIANAGKASRKDLVSGRLQTSGAANPPATGRLGSSAAPDCPWAVAESLAKQDGSSSFGVRAHPDLYEIHPAQPDAHVILAVPVQHLRSRRERTIGGKGSHPMPRQVENLGRYTSERGQGE